MATNNTYRNQFNPATNWNVILNAMPKANRRNYKEVTVAQANRQQIGTPMYRKLNVFDNSVSPVQGHPWTTGV
jgi:hypothetical protein